MSYPKNWNYLDFIRFAKAELRNTTPSRRGIILGYIKVNLDSYQKDAHFSDNTRLLALFELDQYYMKITELRK